MERIELDLIKILGSEPIDTFGWDKVTWRKVYDLAKEHDMHCLLYHLLNQQKHQSWKQFSFAENWQNEYLEETFTLQHFMKEVEHMLFKLSCADIDYIVLKGASLNKYYPNTFVRLMSDVDIFIDKSQMDKAKEVFSKQGYSIDRTSVKDITFQKPGHIPFEVHHTLFTPIHITNGEAFSKEVFRSKVQVGDHEYRLGYEANLAYIIGHAAKHLYFMGIGLKTLYDIYVSLKNSSEEMDVELLVNYLKEISCHKVGIYLIELCRRCFSLEFDHGYEIDEDLVEWLMEKIIRSGRQGQSEYSLVLKILSLQKTKGTSPLVIKLKILFPGLDIMEERYETLSRKPWLLPAFWCIRWAKLLKSKQYKEGLIKGRKTETVEIQNRMFNRLKDERLQFK